MGFLFHTRQEKKQLGKTASIQQNNAAELGVCSAYLLLFVFFQ